MDSTNKGEYWEYFCSYDVELRRNDGIVYFIRDFYRSASGKLNEWSEELIQITVKLKDILLIIIDKLDRLKESYLDDIIELDNVIFALDEAVLAIPDLSSRVKKPEVGDSFKEDDEEENELLKKEEGEEYGPEV